MKRHPDVPEPEEARQLGEFGDALVDGHTPQSRNDLEATMVRVHNALGADRIAGSTMPASLKQSVWEDVMMPTKSSDAHTPWPSRPDHAHTRLHRRALPSIAHAAYRWQAGASLALAIIVLVGLVGIVTQIGGSQRGQEHHAMIDASPEAQNTATLPEVPARCVANGRVTGNAELKTKSIRDWPAPQYTPVQTVSHDQGVAIQTSYLAFLRCEWNALHSATPPATPAPPVLAEPILLTYFSDRARYDRLYSQLAPSQQKELDAYRCRPLVKNLLASFPLPVNQPPDRALVGGAGNGESDAFVPIFSPSDVYRLPDGRFGAIVGTISTAALTDPTTVTDADTLQFFAFTEVDGRYYIDETFTLVAPNMSQLAASGRNGSLATNCP